MGAVIEHVMTVTTITEVYSNIKTVRCRSAVALKSQIWSGGFTLLQLETWRQIRPHLASPDLLVASCTIIRMSTCQLTWPSCLDLEELYERW